MANGNSFNNRIPATSAQPLLIGNGDSPLDATAVSCTSLLSATTNNLVAVETYSASSSGTPAAGFGVAWDFQMDDSTNTLVPSGRITVQWSTATAGAVTSYMSWLTTTSGGALAEALRVSNLGISTNAGTDNFRFSASSWTPVIKGSSVSGTGQVYTSQLGRYVKQGALVTWFCRVIWSSAGTAAGNLFIDGLPFTSESTSNQIWPLSAWGDSTAWGALTQLSGYVDFNATTIQPQAITSGVAAAAVSMPATGSLLLSGFYMTANTT